MNILGELRIPLELGSLVRSDIWHAKGAQRGDDQWVLAIPGLLVGDETLRPMRGWLTRLGYRPLPAGIRSNVQCSERLLTSLEAKLDHAVAIDGRRAHVVGQSRGGMLAHVLAVRRPDLVASVTTLGAPIHATIDDFHPLLRRNLNWLSRVGDARSGLISTSCWAGAPGHPAPDTDEAHEHPDLIDHPERVHTCCENFWPDLAKPLPEGVRGAAVFSRSDGILRAGSCVAPSYRAVEVRASHMGMATSSAVYLAIADNLAASAKVEAGVPRRPAPALIDRRYHHRKSPRHSTFDRRA